jgi:hypothetical protein
VATVGVTVTELYNEGRASAASDRGAYPLAQISERMDERTCPLCQAVDGLILRTDSPEYAEWRQPSHINCRRIMEYIGRDEPAAPDFQRPDQELIRKHGHYHLDPDKHAELRIPAEPSGRHFVLRWLRREGTGEAARALDWAPWWSQVSEADRALVLRARVAPAAELPGLLRPLGLTLGPGGVAAWTPADWRLATRLALRDRLEGFLTVRAVVPPGTPPAAPDFGPEMLPGRTARWARDADARTRDLDALQSVASPEPEDVARIDAHMQEICRAFGVPRGAVARVLINTDDTTAAGVKWWDCTLEVTKLAFRSANRREDDRDYVWRLWVHESLHAREFVGPANASKTLYAQYPGFEEGAVEGYTQYISRRLGWRVAGRSYSAYVEVYEAFIGHYGLDRAEVYRAALALRREDTVQLMAQTLAEMVAEKRGIRVDWNSDHPLVRWRDRTDGALKSLFQRAALRGDPLDVRRRWLEYLTQADAEAGL